MSEGVSNRVKGLLFFRDQLLAQKVTFWHVSKYFRIQMLSGFRKSSKHSMLVFDTRVQSDVSAGLKLSTEVNIIPNRGLWLDVPLELMQRTRKLATHLGPTRCFNFQLYTIYYMHEEKRMVGNTLLFFIPNMENAGSPNPVWQSRVRLTIIIPTLGYSIVFLRLVRFSTLRRTDSARF